MVYVNTVTHILYVPLTTDEKPAAVTPVMGLACPDSCIYIASKKEASKVKQTTRQNNTAHPRQSVTLLKKNELPRVGLEPTTLYTLDGALYH